VSYDRARLPCLYCDEPSGSLEHALASGIGGHFKRRDLVCVPHNGMCGTWADEPLCEQFAFAVHALEVLKGDKTRGTTWPIVADDGTRFDVLPDFRHRMRHTVDRPDGGFRITGTEESAFRKIEKNLAKVADFASSHEETRRYDFTTPVSTSGPGQRGVLKAALHFVAAITCDRERAREVALQYASVLFSDAEPANVQVVPYEVGDDGRDPYRHELVAWTEDDQTLVRVKIFNVVTYLVRLPPIPADPTVYRQSTRDGSRMIGRTLVPHLVVDERVASLEGYQTEFAKRVDALVLLAAYKSDVAALLEEVTTEPLYRMTAGEQARGKVLGEALRERFKFRDGHVTSWMMRDVIGFAGRRIAELSRRPAASA
jgi:hypothetical protein